MEYLIYIAPFVAGVAWYLAREERLRRDSQAPTAPGPRPAGTRIERRPVVNGLKCIGCGSCLTACPEQRHGTVLGLAYAKAWLVNPEACMGHGACEAACPAAAISLMTSG